MSRKNQRPVTAKRASDPHGTPAVESKAVSEAEGDPGVEASGDPLMPPRGTVLPMPDLHSVLRTNLSTALTFLHESFEALQTHVQHHPAVQGYQWDFQEQYKGR